MMLLIHYGHKREDFYCSFSRSLFNRGEVKSGYYNISSTENKCNQTENRRKGIRLEREC